MLTDEIRYRILRELEQDPKISQRALAQNLGVSVGKANFCLRALVDKGLIKVNNFRRSGNKRAYAYHLTPSGMKDKARMTRLFLRRAPPRAAPDPPLWLWSAASLLYRGRQ